MHLFRNRVEGLQLWIYGYGGFAKRLNQVFSENGIEVSGLTSLEKGLPEGVTPTGNLNPEKTIIIMGIFNHFTNLTPIFEALKTFGFIDVFSPQQAHSMVGKGFSTYYLSGDKEELPKEKEVVEISEKLSDDLSRRVLSGFIDFQSTGDLRALIRSADSTMQYLGRTLPEADKARWLGDDVRWLDVGSFDGDTLRSLKSSFPREFPLWNFLCLEPDVYNFEILSRWCNENSSRSRVSNVAAGLKTGSLEFHSSGTLSSGIRATASDVEGEFEVNEISVVPLDELLHEFKATHLKMDIEGAELDALLGGKESIVSSRPKLAISLYHRPRDIVDLPKLLMGWLPDYNWYIRCYGASGYDTILYGIPSH